MDINSMLYHAEYVGDPHQSPATSGIVNGRTIDRDGYLLRIYGEMAAINLATIQAPVVQVWTAEGIGSLSREDFEKQFPELAYFAAMKAKEVQQVRIEASTPGGMLRRNFRVAMTVFQKPTQVCKQFPQRQVCYMDNAPNPVTIGVAATVAASIVALVVRRKYTCGRNKK